MSAADSDRSTIAGDLTTDARDTVLNRWGGEPAIVFGSWRQPRPAATRHRLIWHKTKAAPGYRTLPWYPADEEIYVLGEGFIGHPTQNVLTTTTMQSGANGLVARIGHPTPKPVELMEELIMRCPPEWVIIDPFAGSGSTLRAAKNLGRRSIGFEVDERYCRIAANRLSQEALTL